MMTKEETENTLYYGDNLPIMREYIPDESVDLIYLDPPFNSKATYNILFKSPSGKKSQAQVEAFEDTWHWTLETEQSFDEAMNSGNTQVAEMLRAMREFLGENDMMAYLTMMAIRMLELYRVLKPSGCIYLHCDPTASHYLKILMDAVFSPKNFMNEITWKRTPFSGSSKARTKRYPRNHDILLFYSCSGKYIWNTPKLPYTNEYLKRFNCDDKDGRGPYQKVALKTYSQETYDKLMADNRLIPASKPGVMPRYKQYFSEAPGFRQIDDIWIDINMINPVAKERLGYPTQKPEALLERIILASSNEGDLILDPFCGCGTTIAVAQRLNRRWIGIDITHLAINLIERRLSEAFPGTKFQIIGTPADLDGASDLAERDKYEFQWWALSLVDAHPVGGRKKKGPDEGVDGIIYFKPEGKKTEKAIVSVKGGKSVNVEMIRSLIAVIADKKAEIGVFLSLAKPTSPMIKTAARAGFFETIRGKFPKIQILTIEELLDGKRPNIPFVDTSVAFNKASVVHKNTDNQEELL